MANTLEQIITKVDRIKGNLAGETINQDKILSKMQKLDDFIGGIDKYTDKERKEIEEIKLTFCRWCEDRMH